MSENDSRAGKQPCVAKTAFAADNETNQRAVAHSRDPNLGSRFLPRGRDLAEDVGVAPVSHEAAAELDRAAGLGEGAIPELPDPGVSGLEQFDGLDPAAVEAEIHGTAVSVAGRAALFVGRAASGKSALALSMLTMGAELVADDRVCLAAEDDGIRLTAKSGFSGLIEARGVGILRVDAAQDAKLAVVVDMDRTELHRLPPARTHEILTKNVHLVYGRENWSLGPALFALLSGALVAPDDL